MNLDMIFQQYTNSFYYENSFKVIKLYKLPEGLFLLVNTGMELELLWGVNALCDLKKAIKKIKKENENIKFIVRYASNLNNIIEKKKIIEEWGYKEKNITLRYLYDMNKSIIRHKYECIDNLTSNEIENFISLEQKIFKSLSLSREDLENLLSREDYVILIYKKNNLILGFIIISIFYNNKFCFIRNIGVKSSERKNGIGTNLILAGLSQAKQKGVYEAMLWVNENNITARDFYEELGFYLDESEAEICYNV